jgi:GntR family transcriptional regulator
MQRTNLSDQVAGVIRDRIRSGQYQPKQSLPSIADLALELGVGRTSLREALSRLESQGLIEIHHGKGIYVVESKVETSSQLRSFSETIIALGMKPSSRVIKKMIETADAPLAEKLKILPGEHINYLMRLRLADDLPMAIEVSITPCKLFPDLLQKDGLTNSLYEVFKKGYQKEVYSALRTIEAVLTHPDENKLLELQGRQPALKIDTIAFDQNHFPLEWGKSIYRADRYKFVIQQAR